MDVIQYLAGAFGPAIVEILVSIFGLIGIFAMNVMRKYVGDKSAKILADLLHQALESSVKSQMADGARTPETIADNAISYAERSIPDTLKKLKPDHSVLVDIAKSKIINVLASGAVK